LKELLVHKIKLLRNYLSFWLASGNEHGLHSPFVYHLYTEAIRSNKNYYAFDEIEMLRHQLLNSKDKIAVTDFGAGSRVSSSNQRSISSIAKNSGKPPRLAAILFRIVNMLQPKVIVELGTSLGLTTLYLASANKQSQVYTFEGCENTAGIAFRNFKALKAENITQITGIIDQTLPDQLRKLEQIDMVFFDANHRYEPTIRYFELCLQKAHEGSVFIFDDIYWSDEMIKAWKKIKSHPEITLTVDLFYMSLVFFRKKQPVQHFTLRI
jgi:predicted O-methyltransferase YrrM